MALMYMLAILAAYFSSKVFAQRNDGQFWPCNPLTNGTGACTPNLGLPKSEYFMDFTQQESIPKDWTISNYAEVLYGASGAQFSFEKRYDAPQLWTNFYILFGSVETVMQVAPGKGIISSSVLISDDFDEIDWEFSGNNFGNKGSRGMGQNNYFGKGITGNYDRGQFFNITNPQGQFHTYKVDWTPEQIVWSIDGKPIRTHLAKDGGSGAYQFPQTPCKVQLGLWNGGDPDANAGTRDWAGGTTNFTELEALDVTFYVKSVKITNANPAYGYNYTNASGKWPSIELLQTKPKADGTWTTNSTSTKTPKPTSSSSSTTSKSQTSTRTSSSTTRTSPPSTSSTRTTRSGSSSTTRSTRTSSPTTRSTRTSSQSQSTTRRPSTRPSSSTTRRPTTSRPTTSRPTTSRPTTSRPTTSRPTTSRPTTSRPTTSRPTTSRSTISRPTTSRPTTSRSTTSRPTTSRPTTSRPTISRSTTSRPTTSRPTTSSPTTSRSTTSRPTTSRPTTSRSTTSRPTTSRPTTSRSTTSRTTTCKPTTTRPTTSRSSTRRPTTTAHNHGYGYGRPPHGWGHYGWQAGHRPPWWDRYGWGGRE